MEKIKNFLIKNRHIITPALMLVIIAGTVTAALGATYAVTEGRITANNIAAEREMLKTVISADSFTHIYPEDIEEENEIFEAYKDGELVGYAFKTVSAGKSAGLTVLTGIGSDGVITGAAAAGERETPGYVDKVKSGGLFNRIKGKTAQKLTLGRNIDGVSQATKTSKGIIDGVNKAIEIYNKMVSENA